MAVDSLPWVEGVDLDGPGPVDGDGRPEVLAGGVVELAHLDVYGLGWVDTGVDGELERGGLVDGSGKTDGALGGVVYTVVGCGAARAGGDVLARAGCPDGQDSIGPAQRGCAARDDQW